MKVSYNNREMFALKHTAKDDSTELGLHCGMIFQFICGKNSLFVFLEKVLQLIFLDKQTVMFNGSVMTLVFLSNWWCDCHISVLFMLYLCTIFVIYYFCFSCRCFLLSKLFPFSYFYHIFAKSQSFLLIFITVQFYFIF